MSKKYLRKNEFRIDYNKDHYGKNYDPHPAYITAKKKHLLKANEITHSRKDKYGKTNFEISENPNKLSKDKRKTRISQPFWQNENMFSKEKLSNFRFSRKTQKQIRKYNKKFK